MNVRQLALSGELLKLAAGCQTWREVARRLGVHPKALHSALERMRIKGERYPSIEEIAAGVELPPSNEAATSDFAVVIGKADNSDFESEEPTRETEKPNFSSKWPHLEAFDALGEDEPPLPAIPEGHRVRGVSSLVDPDGNVRAQWIKTSAQNDQRQDWLGAVAKVFAEPTTRAEPIEPPQYADEDLLCVYAMGDPHIGLLAWERDAGENFDMKIAERNIVTAVRQLSSLAPAAAQSLLLTVGDTLHVDNQNNATTAGTRQDVDGRTTKIFETGVRVFRRANEILLSKHARNHNIVERGNHDELLSALMAQALDLHYEYEPRVTVDTSPGMYHWYKFGRNLIGSHHGHGCKPESLTGVMAVDCPQWWAECPHRRMYLGHLHHQITKEVNGLVVDTLPTLAGASAWEFSKGYRAGRVMYMDVIHRVHGLVNRFFVGIEQIRSAA